MDLAYTNIVISGKQMIGTAGRQCLRDIQAFVKQDNYFLKSPGILFVYSEIYCPLNASKQRQNVLNSRFTM